MKGKATGKRVEWSVKRARSNRLGRQTPTPPSEIKRWFCSPPETKGNMTFVREEGKLKKEGKG